MRGRRPCIVIASQCSHWRGNPFSLPPLCKGTPVRTLGRAQLRWQKSLFFDGGVDTLRKHAGGMFLVSIAAAMPPQHPSGLSQHHYADNPPVSLTLDSPLYTRGPVTDSHTSDVGHWFGMTGRAPCGPPHLPSRKKKTPDDCPGFSLQGCRNKERK